MPTEIQKKAEPASGLAGPEPRGPAGLRRLRMAMPMAPRRRCGLMMGPSTFRVVRSADLSGQKCCTAHECPQCESCGAASCSPGRVRDGLAVTWAVSALRASRPLNASAAFGKLGSKSTFGAPLRSPPPAAHHESIKQSKDHRFAIKAENQGQRGPARDLSRRERWRGRLRGRAARCGGRGAQGVEAPACAGAAGREGAGLAPGRR